MSEILTRGALKFTEANTPTRVGEVINTISEIYDISTPRLGMLVYVRDEGKNYTITGLKEKIIEGVVVNNAQVDTFRCFEQELRDNIGSVADGLAATSNALSTEDAEIKSKAAQCDTFNASAYSDKMRLSFKTVDGKNVKDVDLPAATVNAAGVMSAEDKTALRELQRRQEQIQTQINNVKPIQIIDSNIVNAPDEEDITMQDNVLKLKDRSFGNGLGYVILRKDKTFAEQVKKENTIYEVRYDFDLGGEEMALPSNCVLKFEGGSIGNGILNNNIKVIGEPNINCIVRGDIYDVNNDIIVLQTISSKQRVITSQEQFDEIVNEAKNGVPVKAEVHKGTYYMTPATFTAPFELLGNEGVTIKQKNRRFNKAELVSIDNAHYKCRLNKSISPFSTFVYKDKIVEVVEYTTLPEKVNNTEEKIIGIDGSEIQTLTKKGQFKLKAPDGLVLNERCKVFGSYDSAWITSKFVVDGIEDGYMICTQISNASVAGPNLNITRYNMGIDYILYNTHKENNKIYFDKDFIYIPLWCEYVDVIEREYEAYSPTPLITTEYNININNVTFADCASVIKFVQNENSTLHLYRCNVRRVADCAIQIVTLIESEAQVSTVVSCDFRDCAYFDGRIIRIDGWDGNNFKDEADHNVRAIIENCFLKQVEKIQYKHTGQAIMANSNCEIRNNEVCNCTGGGMMLGFGKIAVKSCIVYNDDAFNLAKRRNYSRDFGAIYCNGITSSQNTEDVTYIKNNTQHTILIEGCRIYGYTSQATDGHGIYIDVGRGDVTCRGNIISSVGLYSIDSRWVQANEGYKISTSSIRNVIEDNLLMSPYRLVFGDGVEEEYRTVPKNNFVLEGNRNIVPNETQDIIIEGLEDRGKFIFSNNRDILSGTTSSKLKKIPWIIFKNGESKPFTKNIFWNFTGENSNYNKAIKLTAEIPDILKEYSFKIGLGSTQKIYYDLDVEVQKISNTNTGEKSRLFSVSIKGGGLPLTIVRAKMNEDYTALNIRLFPFDFSGLYKGRMYGHIHLPGKNKVEYALEDFVFDENIVATTILVDNRINLFSENNSTFWEAVKHFYVYIPDTFFVNGNKKYRFNKIGLYRIIGSTDERPVFVKNTYLDNLIIGFEYFDKTLGKPIWWNGAKWVDCNGSDV